VKYLLAISGGIDSVVLLDMLVHDGKHELVVAHFDHGIRSDSASDARFVGELAQKYHLPFVTKREELGKGVSEERARARRYAFLYTEAEAYQATIVTAHHADDIIETIAINLVRGTGWRGLAVLDTPSVVRPLLHLTKANIRSYARVKRLEWVEDSTNGETAYLRNRVRRAIATTIPEDRRLQLLEIWHRQLELKLGIDEEVHHYIREDGTYGRYFFIEVDPLCAQEILRALIITKTKESPTRPQLERALIAIKTARPSTSFEVGGGVSLYFTAHTFLVQTP
jgi:tRNA(Ile)-lysidine synthase